MKIFHASLTREFAGSEMYCASLASGQATQGDDVRVAVRGMRGESDKARIARWRKECGEASVLVVPWWIPGCLESWALGHMMKGFEADVVHTHLGAADKKAGKAARKKKIPWVTSVHLRWKPEMAKANGVICIAAWQKGEIIASKYMGALRVVWNWVPKQRTASSAGVQALRDEWGATDKTIVFGSVGRLHGKKGMDVLIKAFRQLFPLEAKDDVRLVIVGAGEERMKLEIMSGGDKRIILAGYQPETSGFYEAFDTYVSAARYEPFGLTILEAMSHGCQLVCTRTEGPSEFLHEASGKGQVVWAERGNIDSLAAALKMAHVQGRSHITYDLRPFALERALREIGEVYEEVVVR